VPISKPKICGFWPLSCAENKTAFI